MSDNEKMSDRAYVASGNPAVDMFTGALITPKDTLEVDVLDVVDGVALVQTDAGLDIAVDNKQIVYKINS